MTTTKRQDARRLNFPIYDKKNAALVQSLKAAFETQKVGEEVKMNKGKKRFIITRVK